MTPTRGEPIPLEQFFAGREPLSRELFDALRPMVDSLGDIVMRVTKSQVAWRRRRAFAWAWIPKQYLKGDFAPLVMSVDLPRRDASDRWKEIVEPHPGRFIHHLELYRAEQLDDEVLGWLRDAWQAAE